MIEKKELLSENLTAYMDYSMDVMNSLDGAPTHSEEDCLKVNEKIENLKIYLSNLQSSYNETVPKGNSLNSNGSIPDIVL